jgi:multidrug efflux pump subunit AcrA (membrane-fusion protein)
MGENWRRIFFVPPVAVGVLALWYVVANRAPPAQVAPGEVSRSVRTVQVAPVSVVPRIRGYGTVKPAKSWIGVAQVGGRVAYIHPRFQQGATLEAGTELIRISQEDYKLAIAEAEAQIRSAQAKLAEMKVSKVNTEELLRIEQDSLDLKHKSVDAKRALLKRGTLAQLTFDTELRDLLNQKKKVQDLNNNLRLLPTQLAVQQEQIRVNKAKLETAELNLSRTSIRLPFRARISSVDVEISQFVQVGAKVGAADGVKQAEINAQFPISGLRSYFQFVRKGLGVEADNGWQPLEFAERIGLHAIIRLAHGDTDMTWRGRIDRSSETLDEQTRTVGVIAVVDGPYSSAVPGQRPPLVKGMFVQVDLRAKPVPGQIVVPPSALHEGAIYVADKDKRLRVRKVEMLFSGYAYTVIKTELGAGEAIVVSDVSPVIDGLLLKTTRDEVLERELAAAAAGKSLVKGRRAEAK